MGLCLNHGSLFSGIGGFDLASQWMGWNNVFHCEWNGFCQRILNHYWPQAESFGDITAADFTRFAGQIDILTGGFPCQPYSMAGKRLGKEDDRHLWPQMLRAIWEISPRWVVGENVFGIVNWSRGLVFDEVQADLEAEGYEVQPYVLPACAVNAPHRRDRVWFVAHRRNIRFDPRWSKQPLQGIGECSNSSAGNIVRSAPDADINIGCEGRMHKARPEQTERHTGSCDAPRNGRGTWDNFPTQSPVCGRNDGIPAGLDGITVSKHRNESIKAYGNAIVPNVVYQIFKAIEQYESLT